MKPVPTSPPLECDLVMKGGITSGVIYPLAVCELAYDYRLRSIGGSSAGAIAAAAAAVAELGRGSGGFERLAQLPDNLTEQVAGSRSRLFTLFRPERATRGLFGLLTASMGRTGSVQKRALAMAAVRGYPLPALVGALLGVLLAVVGFLVGGAAAWVNLVTALVVVVVGVAVGILWGLKRTVAAMPETGFGMCSGMSSPGEDSPALTPWLHRQLQDIAGRGPKDPPITFGDLAAQGIDLEVMTTNLTRRQPISMPWSAPGYYFDPEEFRRLFPADVVDQMSRAPAPGPAATTVAGWEAELARLQAELGGRLPFPATPDLPIVVAVRMSLSFPGLISAIPLYAVDFTLEANKLHRRLAQEWHRAHPEAPASDAVAEIEPLELRANWFSDGGICANLPLQFFDSPLPLRPTFAIDLASFPEDRRKSKDEYDNSYLPESNSAWLPRRQSVWKPDGLPAMQAFGSSILDTARSWVDEAQLSMPGYRDRIVTIFHDGKEGGMNLDMDPGTVGRLSARGQGGAHRLRTRFAGDQPGVAPAPAWDNHRWVRFRAATAGLDVWLKSFAGHFEEDAGKGSTPYASWVGLTSQARDGSPVEGPGSYKATLGRKLAMDHRVTGLLETATQWNEPEADAFTKDSPAPCPTLKLTPGD